MGYWHIHSIDSALNLDGLADLPRSVEWRLFKCRRDGRLFLDHGYDRNSTWEVEQFSDQPNFYEGWAWSPNSFKFDARHTYLNELASDGSMREQMARPLIIYAQLVSTKIQGRVFFALADDQGHDAACVVDRGAVLKLRFCNGDEVVSVDADGQVTTAPNPYSSDEGTHAAGLVLEESSRHFGYRLSCLDDVAIETPVPIADTFDLIRRSPPRPQRQLSGRKAAWDLIKTFLWRGPH